MNNDSLLDVLKLVVDQTLQKVTISDPIDWEFLFNFSNSQAISGCVFDIVQSQWKSVDKPLPDLLFEWFDLSVQTKRLNSELNKVSVLLTDMFTKAGFQCCILKGQGNALMYPNPLSRIPGDIDIWVQGNRDDIRKYIQQRFPYSKDEDLHIQFSIRPDICVEVHYKPAFLTRKKYDNHLQAFIKNKSAEQFANAKILPNTDGFINVPTIEFNIVFLMAHMMKHFFQDGLGLRQIMDYYYLLLLPQKGLSKDKRKELVDIFDKAGLLKFAKGIMWVENHVFGLPENCHIIDADEKTGRFILKEILAGGNFGRSNKLYKLTQGGYFSRGLASVYRLLRLSIMFPEEVMWNTIWKMNLQIKKL